MDLKSYTNFINESKKVSYSAIVLDEKSHKDLLSRYDIPSGWKEFARHMTINLGELKDKSLIGKKVTMKVVGIGKDDKVIAVKIDSPVKRTIGGTEHITIAVNTKGGGKPVMSNNIKQFKPSKAFTITGTVKELT